MLTIKPKNRKPRNKREEILNAVHIEQLDYPKMMTEVKRQLTNLDETDRIKVKMATFNCLQYLEK